MRPKETIITKHPLYAVYAYYKYYLQLEKYRGFVKFDLEHTSYFARRD